MPLPLGRQYFSTDQYAQRISYSGTNPEYIGEALPVDQNKTSSAVWRIRKILYSGNNVIATIWADKSKDFNKVWNDRATYTY